MITAKRKEEVKTRPADSSKHSQRLNSSNAPQELDWLLEDPDEESWREGSRSGGKSRLPLPRPAQYSAQISQFSLLPEEATRRKHSVDFSGIRFCTSEVPGLPRSKVQERMEIPA